MNFDYSVLDKGMKDAARDIKKDYIGLMATAEVSTEGFNTKQVHGTCVNVYADTGYWDAVIYVIQDESGQQYISPSYYSRHWEHPEIKNWQIKKCDWCNKDVLCGLDHSNGECNYISSSYIRRQSTENNELVVELENGKKYICKERNKRK